jgi:colicin import membrane protein
MSQYVDTFLVSSFPHKNSLRLTIALLVIAIHLGVLGIGTYWNPSPPPTPPQLRSKVLVQTIALNPFQAGATHLSVSTPSLSPLPPPEPLKEQPKPKPPHPVAPTHPTPIHHPEPLKEHPSSKPTHPISSSPFRNELSTHPHEPLSKPLPQEHTITPLKKEAPIKKPIKPVKKPVTNKTAPANPAANLEKKSHQEAEKKHREQMEAEKKRQMEAEKKRKQEYSAAQEAARQQEQVLFNKAKEKLAKIEETRDKIRPSSSSLRLETAELPKELGSLQVDALPLGGTANSGEWETKEIYRYTDEVATRLKMGLLLPDYGAVKIKLTLNCMGKVVKVETIQSESNKNKTYAEKMIPTLLFPSFGERFQGASQHTFSFNLQNES